MTTPPLFPGFDGLMTLSRREGVDIRPTLLRVLTDLYVQTPATHTGDEERQFVELTSRLIDQVDDATRAVVRGRLSIYWSTPLSIMRKLGLQPAGPPSLFPLPAAFPSSLLRPRPRDRRPKPIAHVGAFDGAERRGRISGMFFAAGASERALILHNLAEAPLKPAARIPQRAPRAPSKRWRWPPCRRHRELHAGTRRGADPAGADRGAVVNDPSGEPLACAAKALGMPGDMFQRVLMFLNPEFGASVNNVYRLSHSSTIA